MPSSRPTVLRWSRSRSALEQSTRFCARRQDLGVLEGDEVRRLLAGEPQDDVRGFLDRVVVVAADVVDLARLEVAR